MTASASPVRRWFVPGDLNGFFGLVVDNLSILGFIAAALKFQSEHTPTGHPAVLGE